MANMEWQQYVLVAVSALLAGLVNALAGGGTLISFPALMAVGVPAIAANVSNTVALFPGYLGATLAQRDDLRDQKRRLLIYLPIGALGGLIGGILLLNSGERLFRFLVPYLILLASALLAAGDWIRAWVKRRSAGKTAGPAAGFLSVLPVGLAGVYGGYFGAGLSVIVLAVLGVTVNDSLTRLNALKQAIAFSVNVAAAVLFIFSSQVIWPVVGVMAVSALIGGTLGGKLAGRVKPNVLRWIVVTTGVVVSIFYFIR